MNSIDTLALGQLTMSNLKRMLADFGNTLSEEHEKALQAIANAYVGMAMGKLKGRHAFPLFPGGGKSLSIIAFVNAVYELGYTGMSVAISASRVEALCDLKRAMITQGVPAEIIGLIHSYEFSQDKAERYLENGQLPDGYASEPATDGNRDRQFLLVTHNKVKINGALWDFNWYKDTPRTFVIWDESLIHSKSTSVSLLPLERAIGWAAPGDDSIELQYIKDSVSTIRGNLDVQKKGGAPSIIRLPPLANEEQHRLKKKFAGGEIYSPIRRLTDISQGNLRVIDTGLQLGGVLQYEIVVPKELESVIILDASHEIRDLVGMDNTITSAAKYPNPIVSYENVKIHHMKHGAGRSNITKHFAKKKENRLLAMEIVEVIRHIPDDEGVLIFTFKPRDENGRKLDCRAVLEGHMHDAGINPTAKLKDDRSRFTWLTHGNETSLSKFSYCKNVIFVGALHMAHIDIAAQMAGQSDNLLLDLSPDCIQLATESEVAYCYHQGMTRTACRVVNGGIANAANVWLMYPNNRIRDRINTAMPGVQWCKWQTKYVVPEAMIERIAEKIGSYLSQLLRDGSGTGSLRISTSKIKKAIGDKVSSSTFTRAVQRFCNGTSKWIKTGRSLEYVGSF